MQQRAKRLEKIGVKWMLEGYKDLRCYFPYTGVDNFTVIYRSVRYIKVSFIHLEENSLRYKTCNVYSKIFRVENQRDLRSPDHIETLKAQRLIA